jgi:hypothetical protein
LAFEYFAGLVFNANYSDLESYEGIVKSWLAWSGDLTILVPPCANAFAQGHCVPVVPLTLFKENVWNYSSTYAPRTETIQWQLAKTMGLDYVFRFRLELGYWSGSMYSPSVAYDWWRLFSDGPIGEYLPPASSPVQAGCIVLVTGGAVLGAFTDFIRGKLEVYVADEQTQARDYPEPLATAQAQNGYIFANWAAEKYGLPFAG